MSPRTFASVGRWRCSDDVGEGACQMSLVAEAECVGKLRPIDPVTGIGDAGHVEDTEPLNYPFWPDTDVVGEQPLQGAETVARLSRELVGWLSVRSVLRNRAYGVADLSQLQRPPMWIPFGRFVALCALCRFSRSSSSSWFSASQFGPATRW